MISTFVEGNHIFTSKCMFVCNICLLNGNICDSYCSVGYTSPRDELVIGHSAVALPVLLSEVYSTTCVASPPDEVRAKIKRITASTSASTAASLSFEGGEDLKENGEEGGSCVKDGTCSAEQKLDRSTALVAKKRAARSTLLKIGFVSGSFDGLSGKVVLAMISPGIVQRIKEEDK